MTNPTSRKALAIAASVTPAALAEAMQREAIRRADIAEARRVALDGDAIRAKCQTLEGFIEEFWFILEPTRPLVIGWAVRAIFAHLEAVTNGLIQFLLITVPPGLMKSLAVSVFWPAWEWGPNGRPDLRFLATSFSEANVIRDNVKMRRLVESAKYQALWPDVKFARDQNAKLKFENTRTGSREGRPFGSLTGARGDRLLVDDPHSVDTAESDTERTSAVQTFREALTDRLNDMQTSAIVVIMQRLHQQDVAATILELKLPFEHLNLPMEFEPDRRCSTSIGFIDPRTEDGELLFEERFPRKQIEFLKLAKGAYAYASQYQQRPAPREGALFNRMWFGVAEAVPAGSTRVRKWDLASTKNRHSDYTVGLLMAKDLKGFLYIEDVRRFRGNPAEVEDALVNTAQQDRARYGSVTVGLNKDPAQAGDWQSQYLVSKLLGFTVEVERETGDKETRAGPLASQAQVGNVKIVRGDWNEDFLAEMEVFPNGAHDDQVDAASGALQMLAADSLDVWARLGQG